MAQEILDRLNNHFSCENLADIKPQDIITGDELISDSYDLKEVDGVVYEADCKKITIGPVEVNTGANASAEEAEEGAEDAAETKIDVVYSFRLNETSFDKKSYLSHLKSTTLAQRSYTTH